MRFENQGDYIRYLRQEAGLSITFIAKSLGVDKSYFSKIERGERNMNSELIPQLAALLGVTIKELHSNLIAIELVTEYKGKDYAVEGIKLALAKL